MKIPLLLFLLITYFLPVTGQQLITGTIVDSVTQEPLRGAHITILPSAKVAITNASGTFTIPDLTTGDHDIEVSFVGFTTVVQRIHIQPGKPLKLKISLTPGKMLLSDVMVSANTDRPVNTLSQVDIHLRTISTSQDVLRMVPGLFIAQHAGGGKAEQIFLRGFDIDHGTDINLQVDGIPVNMVSHAHGQGYSDLHFVIPELINYVDFDTGPYYANKGDFTTAGYAAFFTKNVLEKNMVKVEGGQFRLARTVAAFNILSPAKSNHSTAYIAGELFRTDGYFESPQNFHRLNLQGKFNTRLGKRNYLSTTASFFDSKWNASGQIPERAVTSGMITRYGAIDNSEGGNTQRGSVSLNHSYTFSDGATFDQQLYAVHYNFNLFSNFTFYMNDPINGDEIQQQESRRVYGYSASYSKTNSLFKKELRSELGAGFRFDDVDNIALNHVVKRDFINTTKQGNINEGNINFYLNEHLALNSKLSIHAGLRLDHFIFRYDNHLASLDKTVTSTTINPKLTLNYRVNDKVIVYLSTGTGFHSNDARVVVEQDGIQTLPKAYGIDLGTTIKMNDNLILHTAIWRLDLDQEFVYVGDEGNVEPRGKTKRQGVDFSVRYQALPWLFIDADVNATQAKSKEEKEGQNYIPLAPLFSTVGGITIKRNQGLNGSLRYRYLGDRPANETNSIVAKGYWVTDLLINYTRKRYEIGFTIQNLFNTRWNEAQFDTESRLQNESASTSEIHFTPGTPFSAKISFMVVIGQ